MVPVMLGVRVFVTCEDRGYGVIPVRSGVHVCYL